MNPSIDGTENAQVVERENLAHLMTLSVGLDVPDARVKSIPPERLGMETRHAWERWLRALTEKQPLVLVVEDLHWAHPGQIEFLEHLASKIEGWEAGKGRVLFLAVTRPEGKTLTGFERMRLEPLGSEDCGRIAELALRMPAAGSLLKFLTDESGGNPYYVEELSRYLVEKNLVEVRPSEGGGVVVKAHLKPTSEVLKVPDTLNGLLVGRIDGLGREEKEAVKGASVVGSMFWLGVLEAALNRSADRDVKELEGREMVRKRVESELPGEVEYAFRHALLRDAAYSLLTKRDRMRLHGTLGKVLEAKGTTRAKALAAAHWKEAGEAARAHGLYREAAGEALERSAFEEALEYATQGGSALLRAIALARLARNGEALEAVEEVRGAAEASPEEKGRALLVAAGVHEKRGEIELSLGAADEVLGTEGMLPLRAEGLRARGVALYCLGRYNEALVAVTEALQTLREAAEATCPTRAVRNRLALGLNSMGNVHYVRGEYGEARRRYEESLAIRRELGDRHGIAGSLNSMGNVHYARGEYGEARSRYEESLAIQREIGDRHGIAGSLNNIGAVHQARGEHAEAMKANKESLAINRDIGHRSGIATNLDQIGAVHQSLGEHTAAMRTQEESLAIKREIGDRSGIAGSLGNIGILRFDRGEYAEAMKAHEESLALVREIGDRHGISVILNNIGAVHQARGEYAGAMKAHKESLMVAREIGARAMEARALMGLGEAEAALGEPAEGLAHMQQGAALFGCMGMNKEADQARAKIADLARVQK
ncbi:MAG: tetratricopeptide repeat protein [Planctomycetes bacterium]|nr:tetratricopeptide repeat protein [Planctomycetota bacterium]